MTLLLKIYKEKVKPIEQKLRKKNSDHIQIYSNETIFTKVLDMCIWIFRKIILIATAFDRKYGFSNKVSPHFSQLSARIHSLL